MSDEIELHDSRVAVSVVGEVIVLRLCPAYVHHWHRSSAGWRGEGRHQSAEIVISKGSLAPTPADGVYEVSSGWFEVGTRRYENVIPVPLEDHARVRGRLEFVNAEPVKMEGQGVAIRLMGEPEFVENLPPEWAPSSGAV